MTKGNPKWEQFERSVQDLLSLRSTPGSGNQWHDISDGRSKPEDPYRLMVDCKYTERGNFSLNGNVLQDWHDRATELGYYFVLPVKLDGSKGRHKEWVVVHLDDYAELVENHRLMLGVKRCRALLAGESSLCCRRSGHFGHHNNGEKEWSA